jgi:hypothetical protein
MKTRLQLTISVLVEHDENMTEEELLDTFGTECTYSVTADEIEGMRVVDTEFTDIEIE